MLEMEEDCHGQFPSCPIVSSLIIDVHDCGYIETQFRKNRCGE